jgi:multiple sugar transport system substrate-binding protein
MTMKRLWKAGMIAGLALGLVAAGAASAQTMRVFSGGANQRPDLMRKLFDNYEKQNPASRSRLRRVAQRQSCSGNTCQRY